MSNERSNQELQSENSMRWAEKQGAEITSDGRIVLYHGTRDSKKILASGYIRAGSFFAMDEPTARSYAYSSQRRGKPVVFQVAVDPGDVNPGSYWTLTANVPISNVIRTSNPNTIAKCPNCGASLRVYSRKPFICKECGVKLGVR